MFRRTILFMLSLCVLSTASLRAHEDISSQILQNSAISYAVGGPWGAAVNIFAPTLLEPILKDFLSMGSDSKGFLQ